MVENMLLLIPVFVLSLTIHEYAHARVALAFGDSTAEFQGRCSLNPLVHLDPIGLLVLLVTQMFGWAKPVPVCVENLHPRKFGSIMVALGGPLSNLVFAMVLGFACKFLGSIVPPLAYKMVFLGMAINVILCVFNMIPLFPLDGHHIVRELLPPSEQSGFMQWQTKYGPFVLMAILILPRFLGVRGPLGILFGYAMYGMKLLFGL